MLNYIHQMKPSTDIENLIASVNQRMIAYARWYIIEKMLTNHCYFAQLNLRFPHLT